MKLDIHFHVVGNGKRLEDADRDVYFKPEDNDHWFTRLVAALVDEEVKSLGADLDRDGTISTAEYLELVYRTVSRSDELDGAVLLALDATYSPGTGKLDRKRTDLYVSNRFLAPVVSAFNERARKEPAEGRRNKKFLLGASVSPNRADWEEELAWVVAQPETALLKLIPSVQHLDLKDARHREFYRRAGAAGLPILCHVGPEYSFPEGIRRAKLDDYRHLEPLLEEGATVIAAHCGSPVFPGIDRNRLKEFHAFMKSANAGVVRLWADTSALSMSTRIPIIPEILDRFPPEWLLHGSDFPIPIDGWAHLPGITRVDLSDYLAIRRTANPLDRDVKLKRALGFPDEILRNPATVLRMV